MKSAVLTGIRKVEIKEVQEPTTLRDSDVVVSIRATGICGSDVHYYATGRIGNQVVEYPFTIGHEAAGVVKAVGSKVSKVRTGQRVAIDPSVSCGCCDQCLAGREHTCRNNLFLGCPKQLEGSLREVIVLPEANCFPIPDSMSFEQAVLSEPLAIGVYSVDRADLSGEESVAILGAGPIGMSVFHVLRAGKVGEVFLTEKIATRLAASSRLHPRWSGNPDKQDVVKEILALQPLGMDVVFECTGDPEAMLQGIQLLKPGGVLIILGIPEVDTIAVPIHELRRKEIDIRNIRRQVHCTSRAIDLLASRTIDMDWMIRHRFPLSDTAKALALVASRQDGVMKAMVLTEG